jgi:hypothetical protein
VLIPNTQYNINEYNNNLLFDVGAGIIGFKLAEGQYDIAGFISGLEAAFLAVGVTVTISQNALTKKLSLAFAAPIDLVGLEGGSTLAPVIGYEEDRSTDISHPMPYLPQLAGLTKVYVGSDKLSNTTSMISTDGSIYNVFAELDITVPFGFTEHQVEETLDTINSISFPEPRDVSHIDIKLYDQDFNPLNLNGLDIEITLKMHGLE